MKMTRLTEVEKAILLGLIDKRNAVIENKKIDAVSVVSKNNAWKEVELIFNEHEGVVKRNWKQLKKSWENMKAKKKRESMFQRTEAGDNTIARRDTTPEFEIEFSKSPVSNTWDGDTLQPTVVEAPAAPVAPVREGVEATTQGAAEGNTVERELDARLGRVNHAAVDETYLSSMRLELATMDMQVKENEIAASSARRTAAERHAEAASLEVSAARVRLATAREELAKVQEARRQQRVLFVLEQKKMREFFGSQHSQPR